MTVWSTMRMLLFPLFLTASAYECDPGRTNTSARAPCLGWNSTANTTVCEVELGCCWERDAAAVAGIACWAPLLRPAALPSIINRDLEWLGFFGQPGATGYDPAAQHTFATFGAATDLPTLAAGAALGMTSLFRTQLFLVQPGNWSGVPVGQRGHRLFPDYRERWQKLTAELQPWVANGTVRGFHIGDELVWGGLPYADLDAMATMIAATAWGQGPLIIYSNEAAGPIVRNQNCFQRPAGYSKVPDAVTWISFDLYNPPGSVLKNLYEQHLYPKMSPHQKVLLIPDASSSAHLQPAQNGSRSGWAVADMVARAHEFFGWAATDTSGRVVGINPWHWNTVNFTAGDHNSENWYLGIESVPALRKVWAQIGERIVANRKRVLSSAIIL